jgi:hypothetical protein
MNDNYYGNNNYLQNATSQKYKPQLINDRKVQWPMEKHGNIYTKEQIKINNKLTNNNKLLILL